MRRPLALLAAACCLLALYACDAGVPPTPTQVDQPAAQPPAVSSPAPTLTPVPAATFTSIVQATTAWVPPTALAGTAIPGAEATLTAGPAFKRTPLTITNSQGEQVRMTVEVADTEPGRELGLMFRSSMPPDEGMLFDFQGLTTSGFWMANTILPLSIAFIDKDGKIIGIRDMNALDTSTVDAPGPYYYALETNQGFFTAHNIVEGNQVTIGATQSVVIPGMPGCR
ncbi:MAG: DUF192 domain-containing protein [Chloroflexia bacterium]